MLGSELMTVGELSRRTGLSVKAIREYEGLGLIYSSGRSGGGYRLFDETAVWCARVVVELRSLGLTIKEIERLAHNYFSDLDAPIGPRIAAALDRSERRIEAQIEELRATRDRIDAYRERNADALAGRSDADFAAYDPRRSQHAA